MALFDSSRVRWPEVPEVEEVPSNTKKSLMKYVNTKLLKYCGLQIKSTGAKCIYHSLAHTFDLQEILKQQSICVDLAQKAFEDQAAHQEDFVSLLRT